MPRQKVQVDQVLSLSLSLSLWDTDSADPWRLSRRTFQNQFCGRRGSATGSCASNRDAPNRILSMRDKKGRNARINALGLFFVMLLSIMLPVVTLNIASVMLLARRPTTDFFLSLSLSLSLSMRYDITKLRM